MRHACFACESAMEHSSISTIPLVGLLVVSLMAGMPARLAAQTAAPTPVVENGYTLFFLGFALVILAIYNIRRRRS